jgi:hypothetical protein
MNIDEINAYHDEIANAREVLGDTHAGPASRAQASLAACATYFSQIDDGVLQATINEPEVIDDSHKLNKAHENSYMMIGGVSIASITFSNIIHDCKCLKERNVKNIWYVVKRHIPYITIGTFLIIASVLLERSEYES